MIWKISRLKEDPRKPLPTLIDVLAESRLCMSTYAIDKVYGVLGLVREEDAAGAEAPPARAADAAPVLRVLAREGDDASDVLCHRQQ